VDTFPDIVLVDLSERIVEAWRKEFVDVPGVEVKQGSIFDVGAHIMVSPGNSFGFMDGGIDLAISEKFGRCVQERLQKRIRDRHHGELVVGAAEYVELDWEGDMTRYVIAAPTMRVPMVLGRETVNPYLATRAALLMVKNGKHDNGSLLRDHWVEVVAFSGMGTGIGAVPPEVCARQMCSAFEEVVLGKVRFPESWHDAQTRHQLLFRDETWDLQQERH